MRRFENNLDTEIESQISDNSHCFLEILSCMLDREMATRLINEARKMGEDFSTTDVKELSSKYGISEESINMILSNLNIQHESTSNK